MRSAGRAAVYRLKTADLPATVDNEVYSYDKVGNRKTITRGSLSANANTRYYNYAAGTNRLAEIRIGSTSGTLESSFTYDFEGRLTAQTGVGAKTLTWDAKGRVKTVGGESYSYDAMDYRIGRSGGSLGNRSYFLEGEHLESEYSGSNLQARYFRGASTDELVAGFQMDTDGKLKPYLFHHDQVTSTTAISGHNGGTIQQSSYGPFGNTTATTGASPNRLKYTGREDDGTGLYYYRARYYDSVSGRFISEDPLGFGVGMNFYAYVHSNPINTNDPSGLVDVIYSTGALSKYNPITANQNQPGRNYLVADSYGATYPMGSGAIQRTAVEGRPFNNVVGPDQTSGLIDAGRNTIVSNRLSNLSGSPSLLEVGIQSRPGGPWDTKQSLSFQDVYVVNGKAELRDYVGNVSWGTGLNALGVSQSAALRGAQLQGAFSSVGREDARDQEAIKFGYSLPLSGFNRSGVNGAAGGFLLYPNKPNNNSMRSVYEK